MQTLQKAAYVRTTVTVLACIEYPALAQAFGQAAARLVLQSWPTGGESLRPPSVAPGKAEKLSATCSSSVWTVK
jgi:hypothetical protein